MTTAPQRGIAFSGGVSQRTGFFLAGELIEVGTTEQVFERPRERKTDDYIRGRFG